MLMIVPLMIWSARSEIDSQAWSVEISTATRTAATRQIRSGIVSPKIGPGAGLPNIGLTATPTTQAVKAAASIVPSMPMLTTPDRSHSTPHSAARASGVAWFMMFGAFDGMTSTRKPTTWNTIPSSGIPYSPLAIGVMSIRRPPRA